MIEALQRGRRSKRRPRMLFATTLLLASPPAPQGAFVDSAEDFLFARSLAATGDLDGDGVPDVAIGQEAAPGGTGRVWLVSGRDGTPLRRIEPEEPDADFGYPIAAVGDIDGDGVVDLAVASERTWGDEPARLDLYSGADGRRLLTRSFDAPAGASIRLSLATPGDLDADGTPDLVVCVRTTGIPGASGRLIVLSGRDASVLREFEDGGAGARFGAHMAALGDVDGDGLRDLAVTTTCPDPGGAGVVVLSFRDGSMLRRFCAVELRGEEDGWEFGVSIAGVGDVDRDGREELAIAAPAGDGEGPSVVRALSLRTGDVLRVMSRHEGEFGRALAHGITPAGGLLAVGGDSVFEGAVSCFDLATGGLCWQARSPAGDYFGAVLCAVGDVDGDGWTDFVAGCDGRYSRIDGAAVLLSGESGERLWMANAAGLRRELERR